MSLVMLKLTSSVSSAYHINSSIVDFTNETDGNKLISSLSLTCISLEGDNQLLCIS